MADLTLEQLDELEQEWRALILPCDEAFYGARDNGAPLATRWSTVRCMVASYAMAVAKSARRLRFVSFDRRLTMADMTPEKLDELLSDVEKLGEEVDLDRVDQNGFYCTICDDDIHVDDHCDKDEPVVCDTCAIRVTFEHAPALVAEVRRLRERELDLNALIDELRSERDSITSRGPALTGTGGDAGTFRDIETEALRVMIRTLQKQLAACERELKERGDELAEADRQIVVTQDALTETGSQLAACERELERWRHGVQVEGDFVCPDSLRVADMRKLLGDLLEVIPDTYGEAQMAGIIDPGECEGHEWDNRTRAENAVWLIRQRTQQRDDLRALLPRLRKCAECGMCPENDKCPVVLWRLK